MATFGPFKYPVSVCRTIGYTSVSFDSSSQLLIDSITKLTRSEAGTFPMDIKGFSLSDDGIHGIIVAHDSWEVKRYLCSFQLGTPYQIGSLSVTSKIDVSSWADGGVIEAHYSNGGQILQVLDNSGKNEIYNLSSAYSAASATLWRTINDPYYPWFFSEDGLAAFKVYGIPPGSFQLWRLSSPYDLGSVSSKQTESITSGIRRNTEGREGMSMQCNGAGFLRVGRDIEVTHIDPAIQDPGYGRFDVLRLIDFPWHLQFVRYDRPTAMAISGDHIFVCGYDNYVTDIYIRQWVLS